VTAAGTGVNDDELIEPDHLSDLGNARRLVRQFGDEIKYVPVMKRWRVWTGTHWALDETGQVERFAKAVAAGLYVEAGYEGDDRRRKELARHANASESVRGIRGMVTLAQSEPGISVPPHAFDTDPYLYNVFNGIVNLRTGALEPHDRAKLITKFVPIVYDPTARYPVFDAFLQRIFPGKLALIRFVQKAVGYALTGDTREQVIFLCWGGGANGKSTLMLALSRVLADYAATLAAETLLARKGDAGLVLNDLATLQGARFVVAVESDMGRRLAEALVKQLTGGEAIKVKRLYADVFTITPTFKLWIGTNHRPQIRGMDHAIWRRIRLIPFTVTIPEHEQDHALLEKLEAERAGILRWAVEGCLAWQQEGLGTPDDVLSATAQYRAEMDTLGEFLAERCILEPRETVTAAALYNDYTDWAKKAGEQPITKKALGLQLADRGFRNVPKKTARTWQGLRLRTPAELDGDASEPVTHFDGKSGNFQLRARDEGSFQKTRHHASPVTDASPDPAPCSRHPVTPRPDVCDTCRPLVAWARLGELWGGAAPDSPSGATRRRP
jgi:putative DNA primase/helicase